MKLLIVEDEAELCNSIVTYLKSESYACEVAHNLCFSTQENRFYSNTIAFCWDIGLPVWKWFEDPGKKLKENNKTDGVIIVSAKNSIDD
jgi:DNA-binding response OmpR family regulator